MLCRLDETCPSSERHTTFHPGGYTNPKASQSTIFDPGGNLHSEDIDDDNLPEHEIQEILNDVLEPSHDSVDDPKPDEEDIFKDTTKTEEIIILQLSHNPISAALHPLKEMMTMCENIISQLQDSGQQYGHVDGGSMATTTDKLDLLTNIIPIQNGPKLRVADARAHTPTHRGTMKINYMTKTNMQKFDASTPLPYL